MQRGRVGSSPSNCASHSRRLGARRHGATTCSPRVPRSSTDPRTEPATWPSDGTLTLGVAYCFGDSTGAGCPCGNSGGPGEGCSSSTGAGAIMTASGAADVANDSLLLSATQCPAGIPAIFFQGNNPLIRPAFVGDGLLCFSGPIRRFGVTFTSAAGEAGEANSSATRPPRVRATCPQPATSRALPPPLPSALGTLGTRAGLGDHSPRCSS